MAQRSLSGYHFPLANMPVRRMPCLAIQKICASVYGVPTLWNCGTGGNRLPLVFCTVDPAMTAGTVVHEHLPASNQVFVCRGNRVWDFLSFAPHRSANRRCHQVSFPPGRRNVGSYFGETEAQVEHAPKRQKQETEDHPKQKRLHCRLLG